MEISKEEYKKIKNLILLSISNSNTELEILFKGLPLNNKSISKEDFNNVISRLKSYNMEMTSYSDILDIRVLEENTKISSIRYSLNDLSEIQKYCKHNDINMVDGDKSEYIKKFRFNKNKEKIYPVNISNYALKINLNKELPLKKRSLIEFQKNWTKKKKIFRLKKRYTFVTPDKLFKFDLSIVKSSKKNRRGDSYIFSRDLEESNILYNKENYEIELEYIGGTRDKLVNFEGFSLEEKVDTLFQKMIENIGTVLQVLQKSYHIIPRYKKKKILLEYAKLIKNQPNFNGYIDKKCWIGPQAVSLNMKHIRKPNEEENIPFNIRKGYCVTEKADGERHLLYVSKKKEIFLINNRFDLKFTGCYTSNINSCILDGELITKNKKGSNIFLFLIFDLYFLNGDDYRGRQFARTEEDKETNILKSRIELLEEIIGTEPINSKSESEEGEIDELTFEWRIKSFYYGDISKYGEKIFSSCKNILDQENSGVLEYETDGIIFTSVKLPVGGYEIGGKHNNYGVTWNAQFKWKPPQDNTIDFLVEILQTKNNNGKFSDKISYTYREENGEKKMVKYKTLILKTGFNPSINNKIKPSMLLIENKEIVLGKKEYISKEFQPNFPEDKEAYLANIEIDSLFGSNNRIICFKDKNEIENNMIIEMSYDITKEEKWRWVPRNVRYDKTEQLRNGDSQYGNSFTVAENIWKSYHNPITINMITTGKKIPKSVDEEEIYYSRVLSRSKSETKPMLDFHNLFIKNKLINSICKIGNASSLLDLACGKGGDLPKWKVSNLSFVFGIDISKDNIENIRDGACIRYYNQKENFKNLEIIFCVGDTSKNLKNGQAASDSDYNKILKVMYGSSSINKTSLSPGLQKIWNKGSSGFDVVSLQFALHYYFKDLKSLKGIIQNIKDNIKEGGYFIGTCFDGETIFDKLKGIKQNEFIEGFKNKSRIWRIKKGYSNTELKDDHNSLGIPIWVYVETINKVFKEYLVNFKYLKNIMMENGFELASNKSLLPYDLESTGMFSSLYPKLERSEENIGSSLHMEKGEKDFSFMFRYFIFKYVPNKKNLVTLKKKKKLKTKTK